MPEPHHDREITLRTEGTKDRHACKRTQLEGKRPTTAHMYGVQAHEFLDRQGAG